MSATPLWTIAEVARALGLSGQFSGHADRFRHAGQPPGKAGMPVRGVERHAERRLHLQLRQRARRLGICRQGGSCRCGGDDRSAPDRRRQRSATGGQGHADRRPVDVGARGAGALQGPGDRPDRQRRQDQHQGIPCRVSCRLCQPEQLQQFLGRAADAVQCQPRRERVGRRNGHEPDQARSRG